VQKHSSRRSPARHRQLRRDADAADPGRDKPIAAFETSRKCIGVELRAELIGAGHGHGAIGGDVLPAIGECGRDVSRANGVTDKRAGLEQIGMPGAASPSQRLECVPSGWALRDTITRLGNDGWKVARNGRAPANLLTIATTASTIIAYFKSNLRG
jgi:hypothetical protein